MQFLKEMVGKHGAQALENAISQSPDLKSYILPKVISSWFSLVGRFGYEDKIPGLSDSYLFLHKNESNNYDGAITIDDSLFTFDNDSAMHILASIGVALKLDIKNIEIEDKHQLDELGKNIDLLVKANLIHKHKRSPVLFKNENYSIELNKDNYIVTFLPLSKKIAEVESLDKAEAVLEWFDSKLELLKTDKQFGTGGNVQAFKHEAHGKPIKDIKQSAAQEEPTQKVPMTGGQGKNIEPTMTASDRSPIKKSSIFKKKNKIKVLKSELFKQCIECGNLLFKDETFTGCKCFSYLNKMVKLSKTESDFDLVFSPALDEDAISSIIEIIKN